MRKLFFISAFFICFATFSQSFAPTLDTKKDSSSVKIFNLDTLTTPASTKSKKPIGDSLGIAKYGLRIGVDIFSALAPLWNTNSKYNYAIVADYRLTQNIYLATGFGVAENNFNFSGQNSSTKGVYSKLGVNYSIIDGIVSSGDMMYFGAKFVYSNYNMKLWNANIPPDYWHNNTTPISLQKNGMSLFGLEFSVGVEVSIWKNLFIGLRGGYSLVLAGSKPVDSFMPMAAPGFGEIYNGGSSFNASYTISYHIPLTEKIYRKKVKKQDKEKDNQQQKEHKKDPVYKGTIIIEQ